MTPTAKPAVILDAAIPVRSYPTDRLARFYDAAARHAHVPRWFMSPTALAAGSFYAYEAFGCLAILHWSFIPRAHHAVMPPISTSTDTGLAIGAERSMVTHLRDHGFGVRLMDPHDFERLGVDPVDTTPVPGNVEHVYRVGDLAELRPPHFETIRQMRKRAPAQDVHPDFYEGVRALSISAAAQDLTRGWAAWRSKGYGATHAVGLVGVWPDTVVTTLRHGRDLVAWSMAEDVRVGHVLTFRFRDYTARIPQDPIGLVAHYEAVWLTERFGPDRLLTTGAAVRGGAGLEEHKVAKLHPAHSFQVYHLPPTATLPRDAFTRRPVDQPALGL